MKRVRSNPMSIPLPGETKDIPLPPNRRDYEMSSIWTKDWHEWEQRAAEFYQHIAADTLSEAFRATRAIAESIGSGDRVSVLEAVTKAARPVWRAYFALVVWKQNLYAGNSTKLSINRSGKMVDLRAYNEEKINSLIEYLKARTAVISRKEFRGSFAMNRDLSKVTEAETRIRKSLDGFILAHHKTGEEEPRAAVNAFAEGGRYINGTMISIGLDVEGKAFGYAMQIPGGTWAKMIKEAKKLAEHGDISGPSLDSLEESAAADELNAEGVKLLFKLRHARVMELYRFVEKKRSAKQQKVQRDNSSRRPKS